MLRNTTTSQLSKQKTILLQLKQDHHKVTNQSKIAGNAQSPLDDKFVSKSGRSSTVLPNERRARKDVYVDQLNHESVANARCGYKKNHKQLQTNPYDRGLWMNLKEFWFPE
jgi:hypothetical protein